MDIKGHGDVIWGMQVCRGGEAMSFFALFELYQFGDRKHWKCLMRVSGQGGNKVDFSAIGEIENGI